jgi:hypothetical protein
MLFKASNFVGFVLFGTSYKSYFSTQQFQNNKQWFHRFAGVKVALEV